MLQLKVHLKIYSLLKTDKGPVFPRVQKIIFELKKWYGRQYCASKKLQSVVEENTTDAELKAVSAHGEILWFCPLSNIWPSEKTYLLSV